jgi:hypothetical protein
LPKKYKYKSGKNTTIHRVFVINSKNLCVDLVGVRGKYTVVQGRIGSHNLGGIFFQVAPK